uniref:(northern house mosquito) hypothetical protein n=1 Tax=Culex pipiens TaxID=7175 RepID=A0A8D8CXT7_CULPI
MPKPTCRTAVSRASFAASPNNRKHSSAKQVPSKSSFTPIISPIRHTLPSTPGRNNRWKCSIDTVPTRSFIRTGAARWCKGRTASASSATAGCKRVTSSRRPTRESTRGRSSAGTGSTPGCPSSSCTSRTSSLPSTVRGVKTS